MISYPDTVLGGKNFHGGGKTYKLIVKQAKDGTTKICIPKTLQKKTIDWYHQMLCHPGQKKMKKTLEQHFWWPQMREKSEIW